MRTRKPGPLPGIVGCVLELFDELAGQIHKGY